MDFSKINWDVVKQTGGQVLVAIGAVGNALVLSGVLQQAQVDSVVSICTSVLSTVMMVGPAIVVILQQTDKGKAATIARLDANGTQAIVNQLPDPVKQQVADAMPSAVKKEAVNKDPALPNLPPG